VKARHRDHRLFLKIELKSYAAPSLSPPPRQMCLIIIKYIYYYYRKHINIERQIQNLTHTHFFFKYDYTLEYTTESLTGTTCTRLWSTYLISCIIGAFITGKNSAYAYSNTTRIFFYYFFTMYAEKSIKKTYCFFTFLLLIISTSTSS